ncbi:MAG TPA: enoyl-ACP reductase [Phycisphaerae bacterium]|nr:enoyl-ACP reductase [Phycisphaerae bacterium]
MGLLDRRKGLIFGVANDRSIAWHIARNLIDHGADCGFSHLPGEKMERRARKTIENGGIANPWLFPCDVGKDEDIDALFAAVKDHFGTIDFVVHSLAFANKDYLQIGRFAETPRDVFTQALDISAYTLVAVAGRAKPLMPAGGSILTLSYYGAEKVIPGYNVMGVAKAALEACTRYLAAELGAAGIRVNSLSAGPCRTLSAMAVGGIDDMFDWVERKAPLKRNIDTDEVGKTAVYLLSDLSSGVTGENLYVDAGYNIIGL